MTAPAGAFCGNCGQTVESCEMDPEDFALWVDEDDDVRLCRRYMARVPVRHRPCDGWEVRRL